ncbi:hypothetical protein M3P05_15940 [Sansalvadorimonas sp. 2012CJ34-2]|uniref:Uncharacterized protein n=1 Tax=Parendozoicomonas callyspongiae TaxID=2942213 RepID=A0ABT0PJ46_9GAMM|nr:hypothetical protein [Sansalvadorimonas sp. 2012CJ34-2]MCL6271412.1 hypothetical protein [Sansalvadorimonas sp. 2012CJ34-2]
MAPKHIPHGQRKSWRQAIGMVITVAIILSACIRIGYATYLEYEPPTKILDLNKYFNFHQD